MLTKKKLLDKTNKIKAKCQWLLDREAKRRFNEPRSMMSITKQGDALHVAIRVGLPPNFYAIPFCGLIFLVCYHNMKITMEKRKAKQTWVDFNNLQLIKPPWVYTPMLYSFPVLWNATTCWSFARIPISKWEIFTLHASNVNYIKMFLTITLKWGRWGHNVAND